MLLLDEVYKSPNKIDSELEELWQEIDKEGEDELKNDDEYFGTLVNE